MKTARRIGRHCRLVVVIVAAACIDMDLGHKASAHLIKRSMAGLAAVCYLSPASTPSSQAAKAARQVKCQIRHGSTTTTIAATTTETALGAARNLSLNRPRHKVVKRLIEVSLFKRETHLQSQPQPQLQLRLHLQIETSV